MALVERAPSRTDSAFSDVPSFGSDNLESEWFSCSRPPSSLSARNSPFAANPSQQEESEHRSTSSNNNTGRQDLSFTHAANRPAPASSLDTHENLIPVQKLFYPAAHPKPFSFQSPKLGLERRLFTRDVHPEHPSLSPSSTSEVVHGPFDINDLFPSATSSLKTCSLVEEFFTLFTVPASVQPFVQKALLWADTSNRRQMATLLEVIQSINANRSSPLSVNSLDPPELQKTSQPLARQPVASFDPQRQSSAIAIHSPHPSRLGSHRLCNSGTFGSDIVDAVVSKGNKNTNNTTSSGEETLVAQPQSLRRARCIPVTQGAVYLP